MSKQAPVLFVTEYEKRIEQKFQRHGGKLLRTCRNKDPKGKDKVKIFVGGTGEAVERPSRHGDIPYMNSGRTSVELALKAYFAGDPADWEDLESMEVDDIQAIADTSALAIGRKVDDVIIKEINDNAGLTTEGDGTQACSVRMVMNAVEKCCLAHWPEEDGNWYCLLGPNAWGHMMTYKQFANADYVGDRLPWAATSKAGIRDWQGITFIRHTGLTSPASNQENGLLYYGPSVAAAGQPAKSDISWMGGQKQYWSVMDKVRTGAKLSQTAAAIKLHYATNVAYQDVYHTPA